MASPMPGSQDPCSSNPGSLGSHQAGVLHLLPLSERLMLVTETMRELSRQTDPQNMAKVYLRHLRELLPNDGLVAVSRRDLPTPHYRVTRSSQWKEEVDPWLQREKLPVVTGGVLGDLLYGNEPRIIGNFQVDKSDPAFEHLNGFQSMAAIPMYDQGRALVLVGLLSKKANGFDPEKLPDLVLTANLYGRASHNLILARQLEQSVQELDFELRRMEKVQTAMLPSKLPALPSLSLERHHQTARRAGGDYHDFFPHPDGTLGILVADVSGSGASATSLMAIVHTLAHVCPGESRNPAAFLSYLNRHLTDRCNSALDTFVTAFYGVYQPVTRTLRFAMAGHPPPRLLLSGSDGWRRRVLDMADGLPLGLDRHERYGESQVALAQGDLLVLYTDGVTDLESPEGKPFGLSGLDHALALTDPSSDKIMDKVVRALRHHAAGRVQRDDLTLVLARVK